MLKNYVKIAFRNLIGNKVVSLIKIGGLSLGLACCLLILLYTRDELSFDRFQKKKDQLFRVTCEVVRKQDRHVTKYGEAAAVQGPAFKAEIPEVEEFVRVYEKKYVVKAGTESFNEKGTWVDENFFQVFSFPLIIGNPGKVLSDLHYIVLTDAIAEKYFGTINAVGKTLELEINNQFVPFTVSGIARRSPENSSIKFDMLIPFSYYAQMTKNDHGFWHLLNYSTYLLLRPHVNPETICAKMNKTYEKSAGEQLADLNRPGSEMKFTWGLQPFLSMHLDELTINEGSIKDESKPIYSYILTGIAFFILMIACINFINLTIAQSLKRSKEIGLRKVIGGSRIQLIGQFLGESFVLCFIAVVLALLLAGSTLHLFNELANKKISLNYLTDLPAIASCMGLFLLTGFAAGFYPAIVLSGFSPAANLQNRSQMAGRNYLSKGLVVVQFTIATFLIIATLFIYLQYNYLIHTDPGYNDKNLLAVNVPGQERNKHLLKLFKAEFAGVKGVKEVAQKMNGGWGTVVKAGGKDLDIDYDCIDEDYLSTLGVPIIEGRNFSKEFPSDSTNSVIVNEAFVKAAGWKDAVGKTVDYVDDKVCRLTIIGIVRDYHFASLKETISPKLFTTDPKMELGRFLIRLKPGNRTAILKSIEGIYQDLYPWHPFDYFFIDEENKRNYETENRWRQIITYSAFLTIFISCIGLFGLTMASIGKRTKEIGVHKVFGADILQISALITRSFIVLVLFAILLAIPAVWYLASRWLESFPYRILINSWIFVAGGILTLLIAMLTMSVQTLKAANMNPATSLRSE